MTFWQYPPPKPGQYDELFWHATTCTNVMKIRLSGKIIPSYGTGANGRGFYVCPRITDYQKVMARRHWKSSDGDFLYLLHVFVKDFYKMRPYWSDGLAGSIDPDDIDFVAARWAKDCVGPSENKKPDGKHGHYDQYQGKPLDIPGWDRDKGDFQLREGKGWKDKDQYRKEKLEALWQLAQEYPGPCLKKTGDPLLDEYIKTQGPRQTLLHSIEELTFKTPAGPSLSIAGVRVFEPEDIQGFELDRSIELFEIIMRRKGG